MGRKFWVGGGRSLPISGRPEWLEQREGGQSWRDEAGGEQRASFLQPCPNFGSRSETGSTNLQKLGTETALKIEA